MEEVVSRTPDHLLRSPAEDSGRDGVDEDRASLAVEAVDSFTRGGQDQPETLLALTKCFFFALPQLAEDREMLAIPLLQVVPGVFDDELQPPLFVEAAAKGVGETPDLLLSPSEPVREIAAGRVGRGRGPFAGRHVFPKRPEKADIPGTS
jgi:hypothetical protein